MVNTFPEAPRTPPRSFVPEILVPFRISSNWKNVVIALFAQYLALGDPLPRRETLLAILALSLVSSSTYAYNALTDERSDANNANKRHYAHAVRSIGGARLRRLSLAIGFLGLLVALRLPPAFLLLSLGLGLAMILHSSPRFRWKERAFLDMASGGLVTHALRFAASWIAVSAASPPLLPLVGLACAKAGGYLLYKELDRPALLAAGVRNTTTRLSPAQARGVSLAGFLVGFAALAGMIVNGQYHVPALGELPLATAPLSAVFLPPIAVIDAKVRGRIRWSTRRLRTVGMLYFLAASVVVILVL